MINRLEADCEERLKELWIFAWSQKADMQLITVFKLMKQYFMGDSEQLCFCMCFFFSIILRTRRRYAGTRQTRLKNKDFECRSLEVEQVSNWKDQGAVCLDF